MLLTGSFEISLEEKQDKQAPAGRMLINKKYSGGLEGSGIGQMLSKRVEGGASVYAAIEEFEGTVNGKKGSFTLFHTGFMSKSSQKLNITVVEGSGKGELEGIDGTLTITQDNGIHTYRFEYNF